MKMFTARCSRPSKLALAVASAVTLTASMQAAAVIEEVVVTSQKRAESAQDVPVAITAISADNIDNMKLEVASDLTMATPNLIFTGPWGENQPVFAIRGMSMADYAANQSSPISLYVDETSLPVNYLQSVALFDMERVEVLRGPQGTLYGKNTTGGAINLITRAPDFEGTNGYLTLTAGDFNRRQAKGAIEGVLVEDTLAARAAFTYTETDGFWKNNFPGNDDLHNNDTWAGRLVIKYQNDSLDMTLRYGHAETDGRANGVNNSPLLDASGNFVGEAAGQFDARGVSLTPQQTPREPGYDAFEGSSDVGGDYLIDTDILTLTINYDMGDYTFTSVSSWVEGEVLHEADTDGAPYRLLDIDWSANIESVTQDLRVATNFDGAFNTIVGLYYAKEDSEIDNEYRLPTILANVVPTGIGGDQRMSQEKETLGVYSHSTYDLSDQLTLTLGVRYTQDEGDAVSFGELFALDGNGDLTAFSLGVTVPNVATEYSDKEWTGKVGLDYMINDDAMVYASVSRGFRGSAFNGGALFAANEATVVKPEFVNTVEAGFKSQWYDNRLQLNGAVFYSVYKNQQFINVVNALQLLVNGERAEIAGFELEAIATPTSNLQFNLGIGFLDTEYTDLTLANVLDGSDIDLSGNELISAPEWNINLGMDYTFLSNDSGDYRLNLSTAYTSDLWYSAYNDSSPVYEDIKGEAHWVSNGKLTWNSSDEKYVVSAWVRNLTNEDETVYAISLVGFGYNYDVPMLPRHFGVDFKYNF